MSAESEINSEKTTAELISSLKRWKYGTTGFVLVLCLVGCVWLGKDGGFGVKDVLLGIGGSALAAVTLSLYYDTFLHRQQSLEFQRDQALLLQNYSRTVVGPRAVEFMSTDAFKMFVAEILKRPNCLYEIASVAGATTEEEAVSLAHYIKPLIDAPRFRKVSVENKLILDQVDPNRYIWRCRERFVLNRNVLNFRVLITESNDIALQVCKKHEVDCLILISSGMEPSEEWAKDHVSIKAHCLDDFGSRDVGYRTQRINKLDCVKNFDEKLYYTFDVIIEPNKNQTIVSISFDQNLSLIDPYFYWATDTSMYIEEVSIDYSSIATNIGRVSVLSFCASPTLEISHDTKNSMVRAEVGGFLAAGEGIQIIWRNK